MGTNSTMVSPSLKVSLLILAAVTQTVGAFYSSPVLPRGHAPPRKSPSTELSISGLVASVFDKLSDDGSMSKSTQAGTARSFVEAYNKGEIDAAVSFFSENCVVDDVKYGKPCVGVEDLERRLRLERFASNTFIRVDKAISVDREAALKFVIENPGETSASVVRGAAVLRFDDDGKVENMFWIEENMIKGGEVGLKILALSNKITEPAKGDTLDQDSPVEMEQTQVGERLSGPEKYFAAWNRRDMNAAVECFADTIAYDDTAFPDLLSGKANVEAHLIKCASVFPDTFRFVPDTVVDFGSDVCVQWHVEDNGEELLFTRGCSWYALDKRGLITDGIDLVEPAMFKPGTANLFAKTVTQQVSSEPARLVPVAVWLTYIVVVFFSNGILPGADALQLETRTWEEVRDLSLNFFLVAPLLHLPFSPVVHPMLEGVFNILLSWAAMWAGFLSDDRKDKPNLLPAGPIVIGMQFLTSAFLLPYLATRSTERSSEVALDDLSRVARICESRLLGVAMGVVGSVSVAWAFFGRASEFGGFSERWQSFIELLSIDRVGSSFIVDLAIFGLFQFWLIDDDMKRRGMQGDRSPLVLAAKYIPFYGLAGYLMFRPSLGSDKTTSEI